MSRRRKLNADAIRHKIVREVVDRNRIVKVSKVDPRRFSYVSKASTSSSYRLARKIVDTDIRALIHARSLPHHRRVAYVARRVLDSPSRILNHDCRREYSRLLSWRAARSAGGSKRHRSNKELRNDRRNFKRKDC